MNAVTANSISDTASVTAFDDDGEVRTLQEIKLDVIRFALLRNGGCVTRAATQLGIGRTTLYRKLPELTMRTNSPPPLITTCHGSGTVQLL